MLGGNNDCKVNSLVFKIPEKEPEKTVVRPHEEMAVPVRQEPTTALTPVDHDQVDGPFRK
jgi:hypothetical protein